MKQHLADRSPGEALRFLFSPGPILIGQPLLKFYLAPYVLWDWPLQRLIAVSLGFHLANALLINGVGQRLGLSPQVSRSAGWVYLCLFAHFHSFFWPTAAQHVMSLTAILGVLWLYLRTEERLSAREGDWHRGYAATLAVGAVASLGRSTLLAPLLVLSHGLLVSRDPQERFARFIRWMPLYLLFMIYPAWSLSFVGDVILNDAIVRLPAPPLVRMAFLVGFGMVVLVLFRFFLKRNPGRSVRRWLGIGIGLLWVMLLLRDHRQLVLPYNGWVPWAGLWGLFLNPFQGALAVSSTEPYYYLSLLISPFFLGLSAMGALLFFKGFAAEKKGLWLLAIWYVVALIHLLNHYGSFPVRIPSRYMIYLSPIFAWVFCAVGSHGIDHFGRALNWHERLRRAVWILTLTVLCLTNLLAIRLGVFRGKLVNSYGVYEQLRVEDSGTGRGEWPFLLRMLLGAGRLSDVRWMTDGRGLREWLDTVQGHYRSWTVAPHRSWERIRAGMDRELLDYAVGQVLLAAEEVRSGRGVWARRRISELYFLEPDPGRLISWLETDKRVREDPRLSDVPVWLQDPEVFSDPLPWRQDDYGFGRFMMRLILGWDVKSRNDRVNFNG